MARWGIVSTIKAPAADILKFAAYHLDLGASQITICLDDDNPEAEAALNAHPKSRAFRTDRAYWRETCGYVPKKHQVRQVESASRVYRESEDLDWLAHIDVDEFLCPETSIEQALSGMPASAICARVFPCESLCVEDHLGLDPEITYCKARPKEGQGSKELEAALYPTFGGMFKDGFISHTAGKQFLRTGQGKIHFGIHRAFHLAEDKSKTDIPDPPLPGVELCHRHIESWEKWLQIMEFRLTKGSYREDLGKNINPASGRVSKHVMFSSLQTSGKDDLRAFFEEVCLATPELRARLNAHGLLRSYALGLSQKVQKHFPDFVL